MAGWLIGNARARDAIRDNAQSRAALIELLGDILDQLGPRMRGTEHDLRLLGRIADYPLEQIAVPVLALHGTDDDIVAFSHAEAVAIRVPDARVIGVAGGEHVCLFTHRDFVRAEVARFFIEHMPSRAPLAARPGRARNR
jgi:pimeloyl-ACP methyl ester carboxylesterase